jgi:hypothetical protein
MLSRFSRLLSIRLRTVRRRLLCRFPLPQRRSPSECVGRELVLVASPTPPYLRWLIIYRGGTGPMPEPVEPPRAA